MAFSNSCIDMLIGILMVESGLFICVATIFVGIGASAILTLHD
jgi:hypothetical protein